jgi:hypothetical protein
MSAQKPGNYPRDIAQRPSINQLREEDQISFPIITNEELMNKHHREVATPKVEYEDEYNLMLGMKKDSLLREYSQEELKHLEDLMGS